VQALSSHQIHYPVPAASGYIFFDLCFLRDPIDRLRSTYDYFRQRPAEGDPLSDAANNMGFGEFFRCLLERFPEQVDNPQVNLLANGAADRETLPGDLAPAMKRMRQTSFLGVVDCFDQSMIAGQSLLRVIFPALDCSYQPANVSRGLGGTIESRRAQFEEACGKFVYAELLRRNALDEQLVEAARAEVGQRFAVVPDGASQLAALKERAHEAG
jgi:Sulfotransferase family